MNNRNSPDVVRILGYILLFLILWCVIWKAYALISPVEAAPEVETKIVAVHGGLPNPMPEVQRHNNDAEIDLVVKTLACEAPHEPVEGLVAVAWVIRTRTKRKGLSYEQVVKEPYQFSCWNSWIPEHLKRLRDTPEEILSRSHYETLRWIAQGVVSGELSNPLPGATHYYSSCLISAPFWASKFEFAGQIGCHRFYRGE